MLRFGAALLAAVLLTAQAPIPRPSQPSPNSHGAQVQTNSAQQETAKQERGTEEVPLIVKVVGAPEDKDKAAIEAQERAQQAVTEKHLADYTWQLVVVTGILAAIAFVQAILFFWQLLYMREGMADTAAAAKAADRSSRAAVAIELPVVRASPPNDVTWVDQLPVPGTPYGGGVFNGNPLPAKFVINAIGLGNSGRSHALITEIVLGWSITDQLTGEPSFPMTIPCKATDILKADGKGRWDIDLGVELTEAQIQQLANGPASFWLYGGVRFLDFLDESHEARFCWKWGREVDAGLYYFFSPTGLPKSYTKRT